MNESHYIHPTKSSKLVQCTVSDGTPTYTLIESITEYTYYDNARTQETSNSSTTYAKLIHCTDSKNHIYTLGIVTSSFYINKSISKNALENTIFKYNDTLCTVETPVDLNVIVITI